jgi:hypothetical protein
MTRNDKTAAMISGRVIGVGGDGLGSSTRLFADNIGSYYKVLSFSGYDPMISAEKLRLIRLSHVSIVRDPNYYLANRNMLDAYGVETYLGTHTEKFSFLGLPEFERIGSVDDVQIYRNRDADPVAFIAGSKQPLSYHVAGNSVVVDVDDCADGREIVVGFLHDRGWKARADGHETGLTSDGNRRLVAKVEPHTHILELTYSDPLLMQGIALSLAFGVLILCGRLVARWRWPGQTKLETS